MPPVRDDARQQRILVTGGGGFLGRRVLQRIAASGATLASLDLVASSEPSVVDFTGDIADAEVVLGAIGEFRPDVVIHLAYLLGPASSGSPHRAVGVNVVGTSLVLNAARRFGTRRVVYASTVLVHGRQEMFGEAAVNEASAVHPHGTYSAMKWLNEELARSHSENSTMETVGIRLSNLFGHGRVTGSSGTWAGDIVSKPAIGDPVDVPVWRQARASLLYVEDAAEYVSRVVLAESLTSPVYLTGGHGVSMEELAAAVRRAIPDADIRWREPQRPMPPDPVWKVDNSLIAAATSYTPHSLEEAIAHHAAAARAAAGSVP